MEFIYIAALAILGMLMVYTMASPTSPTSPATRPQYVVSAYGVPEIKRRDVDSLDAAQALAWEIREISGGKLRPLIQDRKTGRFVRLS